MRNLTLLALSTLVVTACGLTEREESPELEVTERDGSGGSETTGGGDSKPVTPAGSGGDGMGGAGSGGADVSMAGSGPDIGPCDTREKELLENGGFEEVQMPWSYVAGVLSGSPAFTPGELVMDVPVGGLDDKGFVSQTVEVPEGTYEVVLRGREVVTGRLNEGDRLSFYVLESGVVGGDITLLTLNEGDAQTGSPTWNAFEVVAKVPTGWHRPEKEIRFGAEYLSIAEEDDAPHTYRIDDLSLVARYCE